MDNIAAFHKLAPIPQEYTTILLPRSDTVQDLIIFPLNPPISPIIAWSIDLDIKFTQGPCEFDNKSLPLLRAFEVPPVSVLLRALNTLMKDGSARHQFFEFSLRQSRVTLPIWVLGWWYLIHDIVEARTHWKRAVSNLDALEGPIPTDLRQRLRQLQWRALLPSPFNHSYETTITSLTTYCDPSKWLRGAHINQMSCVLQERLLAANVTKTHILLPEFFESLVRCYKRRGDSDISPPGLRKLPLNASWGALERDGTECVGFCINVAVNDQGARLPDRTDEIEGNHWTSVFINLPSGTIGYGDSLGHKIPEEAAEALYWLLACYRHARFVVTTLPCEHQQDMASCGLYAIDTLLHAALPGGTRLTSRACPMSRLHWLASVLDSLATSKAVEDDTAASINAISDDDTPVSIVSEPTPAVAITKPTRKNVARRKEDSEAEARMEALGDFWERTGLIPAGKGPDDKKKPKTAPRRKGIKRKAVTAVMEDDDDGEGGMAYDCSSDEGVDDGSWHFVDLVKKPVSGKPNGRPRDAFLDTFTVRCYKSTDPETKGFRCITPGCRHFSKTRTRARVIRHALTRCPRVSADLKAKAIGAAIQNAPSTQLENAVAKDSRHPASKRLKVDDSDGAGDGTGTGTGDGHGESGGSRNICDVSGPSRSSSAGSDLYAMAKQTGRAHRTAALNMDLVVLFTSGGLPSNVVSKWEFLRMLATADPKYKVPTRDKLDNEMIPYERAVVEARQTTHLQTSWYLTLSCDGGTTTGREAFWLNHVSDPEGNVFLTLAEDATDVSHTADWITDFNMKTTNRIGPERFAGYVCDSTGNTSLSRPKLKQRIPTIIPFPDACHHISSLLKDIAKLEHFEHLIGIVRKTVSYFHQSHAGIAAFTEARDVLGIPRALDAIGKTRFGSIFWSASSVLRNIPAFERVFQQEDLDFKYAAEYAPILFKNSTPNLVAIGFRTQLAQFVDIGMPACKALACLESNTTNAGDFYLFWHSMLQAILAFIDNKENQVPDAVQLDIRDILCYRHSQLFSPSGGKMYTPAYLVAAYLNPANLLEAGGIFLPETHAISPEELDKYRGIKFLTVHKESLLYLADLIVNEIKYGKNPAFAAFIGHGGKFADVLKTEMSLYARHQFPYNEEIVEVSSLSIVKWWRKAATYGENGGLLLPHIAEKLYSIRVNSMPEERTVSKFTAISTKQRNQIKVGTMASKVIVGQWYRNEHEKAIQTSVPTHTPKFASIQDQFYSIRPSSSPNHAVEPPEYDDEIDESKPTWLDETNTDLYPRQAMLKTYAILDHPRIISMLSKKTKDVLKDDGDVSQLREGGDIDTGSSDGQDTDYSFSL